MTPQTSLTITCFHLCRQFGWSLNDLEVPPQDRPRMIEQFVEIIADQNRTNVETQEERERQARIMSRQFN